MDLPSLIVVNLLILVVLVSLYLKNNHSNSHINQVLSSQKRRLSSMIFSLSDGIILLDENRQLQVANPAVYQLLALPDSGQSLENIMIRMGSSFNLKGGIEQSLSSKNLVRLPTSELGDKSLQVDIDPVRDEIGNLLGVVIIIHDLSFQKELQRMHDDFTAMMIHELRTPLTTLLYGTDMMIEGADKLSKTEMLSQLNIAKSTATHLLSLVNDLLDVAKIEAGKFQIVKAKDDIKRLIEEKVSTFKPLAAQKQLSLSFLADPHLPLVDFDQNRLGQVLDNLLANAIKYTNQGGIEILASVDGPTIKIEVKDSGDGIESTGLAKLFSKFEQLGRGKDGSNKGTGLGLVIAKGIVEAHGGKIWARSEGLGKGSTFGFSLPLS